MERLQDRWLTFFLQVRAVYRVVEFTGVQEQGSYFDKYEWPFWVFDALIVLGKFDNT